MHGAPSVCYPVKRTVRTACLYGTCWLLGCLATVAWLVAVPRIAVVPHGLMALWVFISGAVLWCRWMEQPSGSLGWDGQHWRWHGRDCSAELPEGALAISLDLQQMVLVRFVPAAGKNLWLWLDATLEPAFWHSLRCALKSRPTAGSPGKPGMAS